jgi:hypothetical protein
MKSIDVSGVCNGIVDIFTDVTEQDFASLGFEKGAMRLVEASDQQELPASKMPIAKSQYLPSWEMAASGITALPAVWETPSLTRQIKYLS